MSWVDDARYEVEELVRKAFESCSASADAVRDQALGKSLGSWRAINVALAGGCAAGTLLPGPAALAALAVEIPAVLHVLSRAALGTGWIERGHAVDADYNNILAVWSGELRLDDALLKSVGTKASMAIGSTLTTATGTAIVKAAAGTAAAKAAASASTALYASAFAGAITAVAGRKVAVIGAQQIAAKKFAAKLIARLPARMVPVVGFGVSAALNGYFANSVIDAAESYYRFIGRLPALPPADPT